MSPVLQSLDDLELVLRRHPRVDRHLFHHTFQVLDRYAGQLLARQDAVIRGEPCRGVRSSAPRAIPGNAQLLGNVPGRQGMIAGDHHRADAGRPAGIHGFLDLGAGRVHHAHQADEGHVPLQIGLICTVRLRGKATKGHGQHPLPIVGQSLVGSLNALA